MSRRTLLLLLIAGLPLAAQVKITQGSDRILVDIDGKPFTSFFISTSLNKPHLHPLRAASGTVVTRHYPMEIVAGETTDHPHQRGMWVGHKIVNDVNFWENEPNQTTHGFPAKQAIRKILDIRSGKKTGLLSTAFDWLGRDGKPLLTETRTITFYSDPVLRTMDFDVVLTAVQRTTFGDEKDGFFGVRVADWLNEQEGTGTMTNASGGQKEKQVWGKQSPWVDYAGSTKEGEKLGIAIFDHPTNPRHAPRWHCRGYGLCAANIFGTGMFTNDKKQDASMTLQPGQTLRFRFRVVIHPGDTASANIAGMFAKYAAIK